MCSSCVELAEEAKHVKGRECLLRIVAMLQFFGLGHARGLGLGSYPVNGYLNFQGKRRFVLGFIGKQSAVGEGHIINL